jgi:hypothetical protein
VFKWIYLNAAMGAINGKNSAKSAGFTGKIRRIALNTLKSGALINNIYK